MANNKQSTVSLLIALIGENAARRMMKVKHFGGGSFEFPLSETGLGAAKFAGLAEVVGLANAQRLCKHFGGEKLYIPMEENGELQAAIRKKRNQEMVNNYNSGMSVDELRRKYVLSDRQVRDILKKTDMQPDTPPRVVQESLF